MLSMRIPAEYVSSFPFCFMRENKKKSPQQREENYKSDLESSKMRPNR